MDGEVQEKVKGPFPYIAVCTALRSARNRSHCSHIVAIGGWSLVFLLKCETSVVLHFAVKPVDVHSSYGT